MELALKMNFYRTISIHEKREHELVECQNTFSIISLSPNQLDFNIVFSTMNHKSFETTITLR
jgi:hypothetical protein